MQNIKPVTTVKYTTFVIKYAVVVAPENIKRPAPTDPRRETWNRTAKLIWHVIIALTAILIMITLRTMHIEETATLSICADRTPEIIQDVVEYIKHF